MTAEKGSLEYLKEKRKQYNKKYQDKLKDKLKKVEQLEEQTDEKTDFFFQKMTNANQNQPQPPPVVLQIPEKTLSQQIKNQLIMGSLTMVPMVLSLLLKRLEARQSNSSQKPSTTQSQVLEMQQQPSFW